MAVSNADLLVALAKVGNLFYQRMLSRLDSGDYPPGDSQRGYTTIQSATSVQPAKIEDGRGIVEIHIDLRKAPYAGAYEWGSGEHATQGPRGTYPIRPKRGAYMVFPEGDWPQWVPSDNNIKPWHGMFLLTKVEHPGVEAKPYIAPTVAETQPEVRQILAREFKTMLLRGTKTVEVFK